MLKPKFINPKAINTPLLIVSGSKDWLFSAEEQNVLLATYNAPQLLFQEKPHNLFSCNGWEEVAIGIDVFFNH